MADRKIKARANARPAATHKTINQPDDALVVAPQIKNRCTMTKAAVAVMVVKKEARAREAWAKNAKELSSSFCFYDGGRAITIFFLS